MRWLCLLGVLAACEPGRPEGSCTFWEDCGEGGACEYTAPLGDSRFDCSFADPSCETGRRFGEFASAARADQCVPFVPGFGGLCDDAHPCGPGVDCQLGRCINVAELDATVGAFSARCSSHERAGGDIYLWGFALEVLQIQLSIGVFVDAAPLTAANAALSPPPAVFDVTSFSMGSNFLCTAGTDAAGAPFSSCIGRDPEPGTGLDPDGSNGPGKDTPLGHHDVLAAGDTHACGLRGTMTVDCWGLNADRQIDGTADPGQPGPPIVGYYEASVDLPHRAASLTAGKNFTCAGTTRGVVCWGGASNWAPGTFEFSDGRVQVVQGIPASAVSAVAGGESHACAIVDGLLWCWGSNQGGQVTGAPSALLQLPTQPLGATPVISVAAGLRHTCAVTAEHEVVCWGDNGVGQLGQDTTSHAPQVVPLEARAIGPIALSDDATCVLLEDALVHCWGQPALTTEYDPPLTRFALCLQ